MKNISIITIACLFLALIFTKCKNEDLVTPEGYQYKFYNDESGDDAVPGQWVLIDLDILTDTDSIVQTFRGTDFTPALEVLSPDDSIMVNAKNPLLGVMTKVSKGDSLGIFVPIDSMGNLPVPMRKFKAFEYRLFIRDVMSAVEYEDFKTKEEKRLQEKIEATRLRSDNVAAQIKEYTDLYNSNSLGDKLKETVSGLKYVVIEEGTGLAAVTKSKVDVHYYGTLIDGTMFDNSFRRGREFTFNVGIGSVIRGWDEGLLLMKEGSKLIFFIPSELGYGEAGSPPSIPKNAELVFYVELNKVR